MELLLNDLSLHGQFRNIPEFQVAIRQVMSLRQLASYWGRELYPQRNILNGQVTPSTSLHDALQMFPQNEKRSILQWLTRFGPFWDDSAEHGPDHWIECGDEIVTETALGEAAYSLSSGIRRDLVSFAPSRWEYSPIKVRIAADTETDVKVLNFWQAQELEAALREAEPPITSWAQLESVSRNTFRLLTFSPDCFRYLDGQPFAPGCADRIRIRLAVLDQLVGSVDASGQRTVYGHQLYQSHFTGDRAWFSDSSNSEKQEFEKELTFPGPDGGTVFCTWHGKINNPPYRIHFSWPEQLGAPLYVAYIGLKITRR